MPGDERHTLTVTLEVDATGDPIEGIARDERGAEHPFSGWIGLARALERTLDRRVGDPTDRPPDNKHEVRS